MKKFLSLVLALVMTMSLVTISAGAKDFTDDSSINYDEAIDVMSAVKVVEGYPDGSFNPSKILTRAEAAKIICNMILGPTTASALHADTAPFKDVPADHWAAGYIAYCAQQGIIKGYGNGVFGVNDNLDGHSFMKMLLCALGYDAEIEAFVGGNWTVNVAKQALNIGLDSDLKDDFNGKNPVTREEACLYAFNTLKADLVEYPNKTTIEIGDTTVNLGSGTAKAVSWTTSAAADGNIDETVNAKGARVGDGYIQFAEQYFNKLVKSTDGDAFGRPATKWTYKGVSVGTYAKTAAKTYYKDVKLNAIYADLGMTTAAAKTYLYVNGVGGDVTAVQNVARANDTKLSKVNAGSAVVGAGTIVEAFLNTSTNEVTICAMSVYGGKVTDVKEATSKRDAYVVVTPGTKDAADLANNDATFETTDFAEDDVVAFTYSQKVGSTGIKDMYKMESVEGTLTKRVVGKSVQIGEETISYAKEYDFDTINEGLLANKSSYVVYKDSQGNALWIEESKFGVDAYAYVDAITDSGDGLGANRARLVLSDGTKKTVDLDKNYVSGLAPIVKVAANDLVRFSENSDGTYKLVKITGTASGETSKPFTINSAKATSLTAAVDSETIFVIRKAGETSFKVYTGIKNAPQVTGSTKAEAYIRNGVAKIVFVDDATVLNSSKDITFVATKSVSKVNTSTNDSVDYYVYNAVVNGEITTISVKSTITMNGGARQTVVAGNDETTGTKYQGLIFNTCTFDPTDDTVMDDTSFSGASGVSVAYATGVKKATDSTIKLANSLKDVSAKCAVYEVDDGGDIEAIEFEDIKTNSAAKAVYTMEDGEITNLFIILPKD